MRKVTKIYYADTQYFVLIMYQQLPRNISNCHLILHSKINAFYTVETVLELI